jgi:hypothetical protein
LRNWISGVTAGFVFANASFPFDIVKIKMMSTLSQGASYRKASYREVINVMYQKEGLYGFTRGYTAQVVRDCGTFSNIGIFEFFKRKLMKDDNPNSVSHIQKFLAGGLSAVCSFGLFFPFDTVKVKMQMSDGPRVHVF